MDSGVQERDIVPDDTVELNPGAGAHQTVGINARGSLEILDPPFQI